MFEGSYWKHRSMMLTGARTDVDSLQELASVQRRTGTSSSHLAKMVSIGRGILFSGTTHGCRSIESGLFAADG